MLYHHEPWKKNGVWRNWCSCKVGVTLKLFCWRDSLQPEGAPQAALLPRWKSLPQPYAAGASTKTTTNSPTFPKNHKQRQHHPYTLQQYPHSPHFATTTTTSSINTIPTTTTICTTPTDNRTNKTISISIANTWLHHHNLKHVIRYYHHQNMVLGLCW